MYWHAGSALYLRIQPYPTLSCYSRFGRYPVFVTGVIGGIILFVATAFSPNYICFFILRLFLGILYMFLYMTAFVFGEYIPLHLHFLVTVVTFLRRERTQFRKYWKLFAHPIDGLWINEWINEWMNRAQCLQSRFPLFLFCSAVLHSSLHSSLPLFVNYPLIPIPVFSVMECFGPRYRVTLGIVYQMFFALGIMVTPWMSYGIRRWDVYLIVAGTPSLCMLPFLW